MIPIGTYPMPTDPDNDGIYEDVNGNGRMEFTDVIAFFINIDWIAENECIAAFDYPTTLVTPIQPPNGRIDFNDIINLFREM